MNKDKSVGVEGRWQCQSKANKTFQSHVAVLVIVEILV